MAGGRRRLAAWASRAALWRHGSAAGGIVGTGTAGPDGRAAGAALGRSRLHGPCGQAGARHDALLARTFLGTASIIRAPDILLLKSAASFRTTLPYPTINVTDMHAAVRWSVERLQAAGLAEPAARLRHSFGL